MRRGLQLVTDVLVGLALRTISTKARQIKKKLTPCPCVCFSLCGRDAECFGIPLVLVDAVRASPLY